MRQRTPVLLMRVPAGQQVAPTFIGRVEQLLPAAGLPQPELLTTGHRPKGEIAGAASERFGNLAHQEQIRRTCQQEATRTAVPIDGPLHGAEQTWLALHLVECDRLMTSNQRLRITPCGIEHIEVVQRAVAPFALNELLGQGALAGLSRARDHNSRHHRQPIGEGAADQTGKSIHLVEDFHSPHEC